MPAPRSGRTSSPSGQSSSVARRCTPSAPYSVESSASETSTGAPSGSQRTAATSSSPCAAAPSGRIAVSASRPPSEKTIPIDRRRIWRSRSAHAARQPRLAVPMLHASAAPIPQRDAAACAAIYAPHVEGSADLLRGAGAERGGAGGADRALSARPIPGSSPSATARSSASPTPASTARGAGLPLGGRRLRLRRRGRPRPGRGPAPLRGALRAPARAAASASPAPAITLPNEASVALHESLGFEPVGVYRRDRLEGTAPGATSAGGSSSWLRPGRPPPEPLPRASRCQPGYH